MSVIMKMATQLPIIRPRWSALMSIPPTPSGGSSYRLMVPKQKKHDRRKGREEFLRESQVDKVRDPFAGRVADDCDETRRPHHLAERVHE